ncbi:hypothetical protein BC831DRAFT_302623 [Entophlyctis helioformis]|nr:hypothetical protein BC831DRAFT_302623 [Entophlyctis helioformis]
MEVTHRWLWTVHPTRLRMHPLCPWRPKTINPPWQRLPFPRNAAALVDTIQGLQVCQPNQQRNAVNQQPRSRNVCRSTTLTRSCPTSTDDFRSAAGQTLVQNADASCLPAHPPPVRSNARASQQASTGLQSPSRLTASLLDGSWRQRSSAEMHVSAPAIDCDSQQQQQRDVSSYIVQQGVRRNHQHARGYPVGQKYDADCEMAAGQPLSNRQPLSLRHRSPLAQEASGSQLQGRASSLPQSASLTRPALQAGSVGMAAKVCTPASRDRQPLSLSSSSEHLAQGSVGGEAPPPCKPSATSDVAKVDPQADPCSARDATICAGATQIRIVGPNKIRVQLTRRPPGLLDAQVPKQSASTDACFLPSHEDAVPISPACSAGPAPIAAVATTNSHVAKPAALPIGSQDVHAVGDVDGKDSTVHAVRGKGRTRGGRGRSRGRGRGRSSGRGSGRTQGYAFEKEERRCND